MRKPEITRSAILDSAKRILIDDGLPALTIEGVARKAGVSKGAVLHHYPTKEALVLAVLRREGDAFDEELARLREQDPHPKGSYTRAYLRAAVAEVESLHSGNASDTLPSLEEFRNLPAAQRLIQLYVNRWQKHVENDGLDPAIASLVRYAADGMWVAARAGCSKPPTHDEVVRNLFRMAGRPTENGRKGN